MKYIVRVNQHNEVVSTIMTSEDAPVFFALPEGWRDIEVTERDHRMYSMCLHPWRDKPLIFNEALQAASMAKGKAPDFNAMSRDELKTYALAHDIQVYEDMTRDDLLRHIDIRESKAE
jgi:hypothetical protein